ncbi:Uncharacterized protein Rs2_46031 [Raphanus sativus]|nr:Uncharacterized protein Rs2_46031 [Raphanus sativus]
MAFSPNEKKDSDVEMSEANQASPALDAPALTQTFVEGFSSFQDKMERSRAEMESSVAGPSATSVLTSVAPTLGSDVTLTPDPAVLVLDPTLLQSRSPHFQPLDPMSLCLLEKLSFRSKHLMSRLVRRAPLSRR